MKKHGTIMNIVLGIVGAAIASAILSYFGIVVGDGSATLCPSKSWTALRLPVRR